MPTIGHFAAIERLRREELARIALYAPAIELAAVVECIGRNEGAKQDWTEWRYRQWRRRQGGSS